MINPLETYRDAGAKAGLAMRRRDVALARFQQDWFNRALRLEKPEDRGPCRQAFNEAYREAATPSPIHCL